jgi:signal transduction histidine kinase
MVIVATLALSTMVSNHIVMPIYLNSRGGGAMVSGDVRNVVILSRRLSVAVVIGLGYLYYRFSGGSAALAAIGLISFAGVAQFLPALLGGIFWRGATKAGATLGLAVGFVIWVWTMLLPSFGPDTVLSAATLQNGPWGLSWLRPQALFGVQGIDPIVHAVWWSLSFNTFFFVIMSVLTFPSPMERLQGAQIVNVFQRGSSARGWSTNTVETEDLLIMAQRLLGADEARALFQREASVQGHDSGLPDPSPEFLQRLEKELAGSVGAATAHAMIGQIAVGPGISVQELLAVADESAQILEYSSQLEAKSDELTRTAHKLQQANAKLTQLSVQKDAFLGQISHELRTPMTSIRAFSEILRDAGGLTEEDHTRYASIIHDESVRLTRLLDDLLDLSVLENGQVTLNLQTGTLQDVLDRALQAANLSSGPDIRVVRNAQAEQIGLNTDLDRLTQVCINLIANAQKYCNAPQPRLEIVPRVLTRHIQIDFRDNGDGIPEDEHGVIFEKFARVGNNDGTGAGLGLAICSEIMTRLGGGIRIVPVEKGTVFRIFLPLTQAVAAQ